MSYYYTTPDIQIIPIYDTSYYYPVIYSPAITEEHFIDYNDPFRVTVDNVNVYENGFYSYSYKGYYDIFDQYVEKEIPGPISEQDF